MRSQTKSFAGPIWNVSFGFVRLLLGSYRSFSGEIEGRTRSETYCWITLIPNYGMRLFGVRCFSGLLNVKIDFDEMSTGSVLDLKEPESLFDVN